MIRAIVASAFLVIATCAGQTSHAAQPSHSDDTYYDLVRPNGQPRDDATFDRDLDDCYGQTGASRYAQDTPAFKQCMLGRKWQWQSVRLTPAARRPDCFDMTPSCGDPPP
jgi:hypothetical protein